MLRTITIIGGALLLASCDQGHKGEQANVNGTIVDSTPGETAANTPAHPPANPDAINRTAASAPSAKAIPVALHGRWGMVPKDCGPDASIAKGLMTVDGAQLRFYESVAKPAVVNYPTPMRMEGRFSFSGEGMDWGKDMILSVEGNRLIRTEKDPTVSYSYTRCPT